MKQHFSTLLDETAAFRIDTMSFYTMWPWW